jgi:hypothetical protein
LTDGSLVSSFDASAAAEQGLTAELGIAHLLYMSQTPFALVLAIAFILC